MSRIARIPLSPKPRRGFVLGATGTLAPHDSAQRFAGATTDAWAIDHDAHVLALAAARDLGVSLFLDAEGADLAEGHAHLLGHLIGIDWKESRPVKGIADDPKQIRNRAFHAAAQVFRRVSISDGRPIVLQLEDLHWADGESLDFLAYLAEIDRDVPLLILAFSRPVLFERRAARCAADIHRRIDPAPLDQRASRDLANEILKKLPEAPAALRELVIEGAGGNPFYMQDLVKMVIDQGAIETRAGDGDRWRVDADRLIVTTVPLTFTGVLKPDSMHCPPSSDGRCSKRA